MARSKKAKAEKSTEVATPVKPKVKTTAHKIIRSGLGHKVGEVVNLGVKGVIDYKSKKLIK